MNTMTKIDWVNRSLFFNNKELKYLNNFLRNSNNLTQGNELLKFENGLKKIFKKKKYQCCKFSCIKSRNNFIITQS